MSEELEQEIQRLADLPAEGLINELTACCETLQQLVDPDYVPEEVQEPESFAEALEEIEAPEEPEQPVAASEEHPPAPDEPLVLEMVTADDLLGMAPHIIKVQTPVNSLLSLQEQFPEFTEPFFAMPLETNGETTTVEDVILSLSNDEIEEEAEVVIDVNVLRHVLFPDMFQDEEAPETEKAEEPTAEQEPEEAYEDDGRSIAEVVQEVLASPDDARDSSYTIAELKESGSAPLIEKAMKRQQAILDKLSANFKEEDNEIPYADVIEKIISQGPTETAPDPEPDEPEAEENPEEPAQESSGYADDIANLLANADLSDTSPTPASENGGDDLIDALFSKDPDDPSAPAGIFQSAAEDKENLDISEIDALFNSQPEEPDSQPQQKPEESTSEERLNEEEINKLFEDQQQATPETNETNETLSQNEIENLLNGTGFDLEENTDKDVLDSNEIDKLFSSPDDAPLSVKDEEVEEWHKKNTESNTPINEEKIDPETFRDEDKGQTVDQDEIEKLFGNNS